MAEINVKIDVFEGPLDLLLHLIQQLELDIYDIPMAEVTAQYLAYLHTMKELELDIAGDYLVMAATLMAIKSKMLLPKQELILDDEDESFYEDGEDPRDALVEQLLEYRKYKYAATVLKDKEEERSQYYTKTPTNLQHLQTEVPLKSEQITTIDLFMAFHEMLTKKNRKIPMQTKIKAEEITIDDKMKLILNKLSSHQSRNGLLFEEFFDATTKSELVTTFMALLELIKEGTIRINQEEICGDILVFENQESVNQGEGKNE
ncbi:segregation/condensation protein A [Carnobacterium divergens]|uniref:segregation/condensation protein A n=1 Tax=Carnobacterium divergens TaxID=2748 RepID=UPI0010715F91|nr:segregation/condensation protein A [Carnobacterium divergens]MDT1996361.1 segregation/condensation protein A [Carnobacterium divergens]TFI62712.1 segregation/condensation protein A [Carnobacterium divergens]TFI63062.1 segregation/condensation protein A [Carnobacterium divergens]TFI67149.1 segregation/condensation protein A [Carnobacterium divergens]TFI78057.1 segregation/condensation protein A [Carnobacterium divergens]